MHPLPMNFCVPAAHCGHWGHTPPQHGGHGIPPGEPQAQKSCFWEGEETSHGGIHCQNGHAYKYDDGAWVKDTSSNDECSDSTGNPVG
jgi:hypothetical protein